VKGLGHAASREDRLLWILGGAVATLTVASVVGINFWPAADESERSASARSTPAAHTVGARDGAPLQPDEGIRAKLRRAELALDAGMLLEPQAISAWTLFSAILDSDPDNAAAAAGLTRVADRLVDRIIASRQTDGSLDWRRVANTILERLPDHPGAQALIAGNGSVGPGLAPDLAIAAPREGEDDPLSGLTKIDAIPEIFAEFSAALAARRFVDPPHGSAKSHLRAMRALNPGHELTARAEHELFDAVMASFEQSLDALETQAALEWLDVADDIAVDPERVRAAREHTLDFMAALDASVPIDAKELKLVEYVEPEYPKQALLDNAEGWVDVDFTLTSAGYTRDIAVSGSSHETMFTNEAAYAVALWRFEPFEIMGRPVNQRAYAHITFELD
jgi:TonB family protein